MYDRLITGLMLVVAVVHLLPLSGFLGVDRLAVLYGTDITDPNLEILLRHRAVLFAILGSFIAIAAFRPEYQPAAFAMALVSIASFLYLSMTIADYNAAIRRVVIVDLVASLFLVLALVLYLLKR